MSRELLHCETIVSTSPRLRQSRHSSLMTVGLLLSTYYMDPCGALRHFDGWQEYLDNPMFLRLFMPRKLLYDSVHRMMLQQREWTTRACWIRLHGVWISTSSNSQVENLALKRHTEADAESEPLYPRVDDGREVPTPKSRHNRRCA